MTDNISPANGTTSAPASATRKPAPKSAVAKTRAAANKALDRTLDGARDAADRTVKAIDSNPIPVLVGGLAIGALAGALLPRSKREAELLAPVGQRIRATTSGAVSAAKDVGINELGALGLSKSALNDQAGKLVGNILKAIATAGTAAVLASKDASAKKAG